MNIIVPLAGKDKNFEERGMVKPLTKVCGKEIIKWIVESRPFSYENAIFIILREHEQQYNLTSELRRIIGNNIRIITAEEITESSVHSILLAKELIDNNEPLLIDLGDQYLDLEGFDKFMFKEFMKSDKEKFDGIIPTFEAYYWNQGYMIIGEDKLVKKISEKDKTPVSTHSTACISYFKKGSDFVRYAEQMILKKRTAATGVYLPSLVYNEVIDDGKKVTTCPCKLIVNLGRIQGADVFEQINRPLKWKQN